MFEQAGLQGTQMGPNGPRGALGAPRVALGAPRVALGAPRVALVAKKMTKRRKCFRSTVALPVLFVISVDAPRRALGRDDAAFSCPKPRWSGVCVAKRAFS